ncbi:MAG: TrkA family potassium uptake protein [candidate division WOR-3 bacterium]|nr:MAG: TrkA family potassium uptake protein [candidate division WOR-3 bacterium]
MAQFAVIGLGTFGKKVATTLAEKGADVIAIDKSRESVDSIKEDVSAAIVLDSTDEEAMKAADIQDVDAAVVALGDNQEEAILITAILKKMGVSRIIARAINKLYAHVLKSVGADTVIVIEERMGEDVAKRLLSPEIYQQVVLTTGHSLVEIEVRPEFVGKSLRQLDLRKTYGVNIIAIQKKIAQVNDEGKINYKVEVNDIPGPDDKLEKGDILVVVGADESIEKMGTMEKEK